MSGHGPRAIALVGAAGAGKTTLLEAMMFAAGSISKLGSVDAGASVGDASPEARKRGQSVEVNIAGFSFMGDRYSVFDCPGSLEFAGGVESILPAVDLALIVAEPNPEKAILLQPIFKELERLKIPHAVFINKIDQARGPLDGFVSALTPISQGHIVARQIPMIEGEQVKGFIDLALERAFVYRPGQPSERVDLPETVADEEARARFHMLEQLADFDDTLLEELLSDVAPSAEEVFKDLTSELAEGQIVPVFFGSALNTFGVRRLLKALRHEAPAVDRAAARLGLDGPCAYAMRASYAGQAGKMTYARVMGGKLPDGSDLTDSEGRHSRVSGLFLLEGGAQRKVSQAEGGDVVAMAKLDQAAVGQVLSFDGKARRIAADVRPPKPLFWLNIAARERKDDTRIATALAKLVEEDPSLNLAHVHETQETLLGGLGESHLQVAIDRLRRRYNLEVTTTRPRVSYRESIRAAVTQRGRHKKQTGGHGQFGDVVLEIKPGAPGSGLAFDQKITGGVVPKQWIPAVEQGVRDAAIRGPLGFPVVDVNVVLTDGSYHAVDSSEMAFRAAGRLGMAEGLKSCSSYLLEPIEKVTIHAPSNATPKITAAISSRRGQILGFQPRDGWTGWDDIEVYLPQRERQDLIAELRGLTQGLGAFEAGFDHMSEVGGRIAEEIVKEERPSA